MRYLVGSQNRKSKEKRDRPNVSAKRRVGRYQSKKGDGRSQ
jgi:hypothetical protein